MCCFACSCLSPLQLDTVNSCCSSSCVSTCTCFLLLAPYPLNCLFFRCSPRRFLYLDFSLSLYGTSLVVLVFLFVGVRNRLFRSFVPCISWKWLQRHPKRRNKIRKDVYSSRCYLLIHFVTSISLSIQHQSIRLPLANTSTMHRESSVDVELVDVQDSSCLFRSLFACFVFE